MFSGTHRHSEHQPNNSATYGVLGPEIDFLMCQGMEAGRSIFGAVAILCFAVGVPATVAILWEMFKTFRRGSPITPNDFFLLNLSIIDGIFLAVLPLGLLNQFILHIGMFERVWNITYAFNTCGRPLMMASTCLDCYLAVVHPITYHKRKSLVPRVVLAVIVWTVTTAKGILYFVMPHLYFTLLSTLAFIVAIVIIGFCDSFILYTLVRSDSGRKNIHPQKQRAIQTLGDSLVMTILTYLPPVLIIGIGRPLISSQQTYACVIGFPVTVCSTLGSCIMPLMHLHNHGKLDCFRRWLCG